MLGEGTNPAEGRSIVVKDHLFEQKVLPAFKSAILLLRNPLNATLAEFSRRKSRSHTGAIDVKLFRSPGMSMIT